jgi:arabinogalactan endo-1,4-beta-galactosidase
VPLGEIESRPNHVFFTSLAGIAVGSSDTKSTSTATAASWVKLHKALGNRIADNQRHDPSPFFYKGHDLSSLKMLEEGDCIYKDTSRQNQTRPAEAILGDGGMNSVRLRIWVNPVGGTNGLQYNLDLAKRFQNEGYKIYLDFHFS